MCYAGEHAGVGCFTDSCRKCDECKEGEENYCSTGGLCGISLSLSLSLSTYIYIYIYIPLIYIDPIPKQLNIEIACIRFLFYLPDTLDNPRNVWCKGARGVPTHWRNPRRLLI